MNDTHVSAAGARILLVDDESSVLRSFRYCLEDAGHRVTTAQSGAQALAALEREVFDVAFLDVGLGEENGLDLLPRLKGAAPWMRVVVATAQTSIDTAVEAMRAGASDYLLKPCTSDQLRFCASKQIEARSLEARVEALESERSANLAPDLGSSTPGMAQVLDEARRVADTDASVLILGESGTGKGVLARAIHAWSLRARGNLVTVNCPSLSADLLESELFGHAKGAFTGATESTQGRMAQADGGTLFLDEIGDFPLALQPKLLRFVQDKEYERVGDPATRRADVRIVAATNRDLDAMVAEGLFRQDLLYRLNVITLRLPSLRERPDDVIELAERSLLDFAANYRRPARSFTTAAESAIRAYAWPGNIRELRNAIERAVILCPDSKIDLPHLSIAPGGNASQGAVRVGAEVTLAELERAHVLAVMANAPTLDAAARILGIDSSTLYRKRRQYGV